MTLYGKPETAVAVVVTADDSHLKQERAKRTRQEILLSAARTFERVGYAAARLDDIGRDAEVTKGALYFHFRSKADLARAVLDAHHARWRQLYDELSEAGLDPLTMVVALSFAVAQNYRTSEIARAGVRLGNEYQSIDAELPTPFVGWVAEIGKLLAAAADQHLLAPNVDSAAAARSIVASYFGLQYVSARLHGGQDLIDRLREWWQLFLPAVTAAPRAEGILDRIDATGALRRS